MSIGRLDIKSLISLVDEDQLREELDKNVYYWYWYCPATTCDEYEAKYHRFKTDINPFEYLIFNDDKFTGVLLDNAFPDIKKKILLDIQNDYIKYKNREQTTCIYIDYLNRVYDDCIEEIDKEFKVNRLNEYLSWNSTEFAKIIWDNLLCVKLNDIVYRLNNPRLTGNSRLHLLGSDFRHIFPSDYQYKYESSKKIFLECGFKE